LESVWLRYNVIIVIQFDKRKEKNCLFNTILMSSSDIRDILQIGAAAEPTQKKQKTVAEKRPGTIFEIHA
jgi:hypothetical protein